MDNNNNNLNQQFNNMLAGNQNLFLKPTDQQQNQIYKVNRLFK